MAATTQCAVAKRASRGGLRCVSAHQRLLCRLPRCSESVLLLAAADSSSSSGALAHVIEGIKPGVKVFDLCVRGDSFVEECVRPLASSGLVRQQFPERLTAA